MTTHKPPIIRPGQCHAYHKGNQREIDERIGCVARLLQAGTRRSKIHRVVREKFSIEWRQCDRYVNSLIHLKWEPEQNWDSEF